MHGYLIYNKVIGFSGGNKYDYATSSSYNPVRLARFAQPFCLLSLPMSSYLPLLDELCCRTASSFIKSCLESDSRIVSVVARYGVYSGRMDSQLGRNDFFCCSRYDVTDILSVLNR